MADCSCSHSRSEFEKNKALADELDNLEQEALRKTKYRQQLMESPEIKTLQLQLRTAYTRKALQAQLDEQKLEKIKSAFDYNAEINKFEEQLKRDTEEESAWQQRESIRKLEYRKILQDQMINKYKEKQEEFRESLKEREYNENVAKTVLEEDRREVQRQLNQKEICKKEMEEFKQAKAKWIIKEKQIEVDEERRIQQYLENKQKEEEYFNQREKEKQERLEKSQKLVADIISQNEDTREEHARVIQLIVEEKEREKAKTRELEEMMKEEKSKKLLREAFICQIEERLHRLYLQKLNEEDYVKKKMEEYEEDRQYQQMTAQKQRLMKLEYRVSLQKEFEEKQMRRKMEEDQLMELKKLDEKVQEERSKLLEEERIKLLQDHAVHVLGFLPPGLIQPSDLPHLPPDVKEFYSVNPKPMEPPAR